MYEYCICIILMAVSTHESNALSEENFKFTHFLAIFVFFVDPFLDSFNIFLCIIGTSWSHMYLMPFRICCKEKGQGTPLYIIFSWEFLTEFGISIKVQVSQRWHNMTLVQAQYHQLIMTGNVNLSLYSII
jgi:hypothetical protein